MRIIHTADWHIGQTLAGFTRENEHRAALAELVSIAAARSVDAVIIAGDIFDHQNPSGEAQRLYFETIVALKRACPRMTIVVTAGNHDAAGRLEAPAELLRSLDVHVVGNVRRVAGRIDAAHHLVNLRGATGTIEARVLAVSYPTAACLPPFGSIADSEGHSSTVEATRALYDELMRETGADRDGAPLIVTGHLHVLGAMESEGAERRILVGGQHAVPVSIFPEQARYVALGHLHKPQSIGRATVRYSGSLFPLSATELGYRHGVTLVTLDGGRVEVEEIPISRPVAFLRVPGSGDIGLDELPDRLAALGLASDLALDQRPFLQIHLSRNGLPPGHRELVDRIAAKFPVRVAGIAVTPSQQSDVRDEAGNETIRLADLQPEHIFELAFAQAFGGREPNDEHRAAFHQALAAVAAEA
mgnify:CR=1 FL=1